MLDNNMLLLIKLSIKAGKIASKEIILAKTLQNGRKNRKGTTT
jgi:hypothetical protein